MANFNLTRDYHVPPKTEAEKKAADEAYNRAVNKMIAKGEDEGYGLIHNVYGGVDVADSPNSKGEMRQGGRVVSRDGLGDALQGMDDEQRQKLLGFVDALDAALGGVKISVEQKDEFGNVVPYEGGDVDSVDGVDGVDSVDGVDTDDEPKSMHMWFHGGGMRREIKGVGVASIFGKVFDSIKAKAESLSSDERSMSSEKGVDGVGSATSSSGNGMSGGNSVDSVDGVGSATSSSGNSMSGGNGVDSARRKAPVPVEYEIQFQYEQGGEAIQSGGCVLDTGLLWCCRRETYVCKEAAGVVFQIEAIFKGDKPPRFANCVYADTYAEIKAKANTAYKAWDKHFAVVKAGEGDEQNGTLLGIFNTWDDADKYVHAAKVKGGVRVERDVDEAGGDNEQAEQGGVDYAEWCELDGKSSIFVAPYAAFMAKENADAALEYDTREFAEMFKNAKKAFSKNRDMSKEYYAIDLQESARKGVPCFIVLSKRTGMRVWDVQF